MYYIPYHLGEQMRTRIFEAHKAQKDFSKKFGFLKHTKLPFYQRTTIFSTAFGKKTQTFFGQNDKLPMYDSRPKVNVNSLYFLGGNFEGKKKSKKYF